MKSNKGKYLVIAGLAVTAIGTIGISMMDSSSRPKSANINESEQNGVITQKVIRETVITESPREMTITPIPVLTAEDKQFLNNLRKEEALNHEKKTSSLKAEIAEAKAAEASSLSNMATSVEVNSITGGGKPVSINKVSNINIGVNETEASPIDKANAEKSHREYEIKEAFRGIEIASLSTNESGTDAWISQNEALHHISVGYVFNGLIVRNITQNKVKLAQLKTGFEKTFQLTSINIPEKVEEPTSSYPRGNVPNRSSVDSVKQFLKNNREG